MDESQTIAVLGAGIVGVACALELQRRGMRVVLVDRSDPGRETSYGNAGVMARSSLVPFNNPGLWRGLPRLLGNRTASFRYDPFFLARNVRWAGGFLLRARRRPFEQTAAALDALIRLSAGEHRRLLAQAGASDRLRDNGWLFVYRSVAAYDGSALARASLERFGVATETLDAAALAQLEPALAPIFPRTLWVKDTLSVDNPGAVVKAYADLFSSRGGQVERREITGIERLPGDGAGAGWQLRDRSGNSLRAQRVVVALGPWAPEFLAPLGIRVPMAFERGYHMHYEAPEGARLGRPIHDPAGAYVLSPMEQGLRLTTGVELARRDAPASPEQLTLAEQAAREAFPLGRRLEPQAWLGCRPTLPDSRPIIGEAPGHPGLWLAFGHQHIGLSTATGTALLLGALMAGDAPPIEAAPFRPGRFLSIRS